MNFDDYKEELELLNDMRQTYALLLILLNKLQTKADSYIQEVTARQIMLLVAIGHLDKSQRSIVNIASSLGTSKQNITRLVNSMVNSGYLISTPSETDKRSVNISFTEKGLHVLNINLATANKFFPDTFKDFSKVQLKTLRNLLTKLAVNNCKQMGFGQSLEINEKEISDDDMDDFVEVLNDIRESEFWK